MRAHEERRLGLSILSAADSVKKGKPAEAIAKALLSDLETASGPKRTSGILFRYLSIT